MKQGYLKLISESEGKSIDRDIASMFAPEKKSFLPSMAFVDYLAYGGNSDLMAFEAIRLYKQCKPLFHAVNIRANAFAQLPIIVTDKTGKPIEHEVMELLANPNPSLSGRMFLRDLSVYFDVCGVAYLYLTGNASQPPMELFTVSPQDVVVTLGQRYIGAQGSFTISQPQLQGQFTLSPSELGGSYRYYSGDDKELAQVLDCSPGSMSESNRAHSPASTLWLQIQQFIEADTNNYSLLKRGARPSVAWAWKHEEPMTDEQYQRWVEQVKAYEGASNAGRQVLVDNLEPKVISQNNRDMEFAVNRKAVSNDIYTAYNVPLALVSDDSMTMDNLKVSTAIMYDMAILPHADKILSVMTKTLMPRYKNSEGLFLTYDRSEIPALRERTWQEAKLMMETGALERNEIRAQVGYEAVNNPEEPAGKLMDDEKSYSGYLAGLKDAAGQPVFTKAEIDIMSARHVRR